MPRNKSIVPCVVLIFIFMRTFVATVGPMSQCRIFCLRTSYIQDREPRYYHSSMVYHFPAGIFHLGLGDSVFSVSSCLLLQLYFGRKQRGDQERRLIAAFRITALAPFATDDMKKDRNARDGTPIYIIACDVSTPSVSRK